MNKNDLLRRLFGGLENDAMRTDEPTAKDPKMRIDIASHLGGR